MKSYLLAVASFLTLTFSGYSQETLLKLKSADYKLTANIDQLTFENLEIAKYKGAYYVYVHFTSIPTNIQKERLKENGLELDYFVTNNTYYAKLLSTAKFSNLASFGVDGIYAVTPQFKMDYKLATENYPEHAWLGKKVQVIVQKRADLSANELKYHLQNFGADILSSYEFSNLTTIAVLPQHLISIASHPMVTYMEPIDPEPVKEDLLGQTNHRVNWLGNKNINGISYNGEGVWMAVGDDGEIGPHIDFQGRTDQTVAGASSGEHGDHVCGIAVGAGNLDPDAQGMAWASDLKVYNVWNAIYDSPTSVTNPGIVVTSTSYGNGCNAGYTSFANTVDQQVRQLGTIMHIFSAGNSGTQNCGYGAGSGWGNITGGNKSAKNVMAIGNVLATDGLANSSSRGPAADGRIKPDVCANGTQVYSAFPNNQYVSNTGTSMAAPGASGTYTALVHAFKTLNGDTVPPSALIKATMMNTADDLGNKGPDFSYGWGRINARKALEVFKNNRFIFDTIAQGDSNSHVINIPANAKEVKIMVYWNDYEASANATTALVNNLDMTVVDGSNVTHLPFVLNTTPTASALNSPATRGVDDLNNMEQVYFQNPTNTNFIVKVKGKAIPQGPQGYVIVYTYEMDNLTVTYPSNGECLEAGTAELIRWDAIDTIGSITVEYSTNNGTSWTTINSNVPFNRAYQNFNVPNTVTSTALIRLTQGSFSTVSQPFSIIDRPNNVIFSSVCPSDFTLSWDSVPGATAYEVSMLGAKFMDSVITVTDTFAVIASPVIKEEWVAVKAMGNGIVGKRTIALLKPTVVTNCSLANDIAALDILSPGGNSLFDCMNTSMLPIKVRLRNTGATLKTNFNLSYSLNGVTSTKVLFTDTILPGNTADFTFPSTLNVPAGTNELAFIIDAGDQNVYNDTIKKNFQLYSNSVVVTAPYFQNFDNFNGCSTANNCEFGVCQLSQGWTNLTNTVWDDFDFRTNSGSTASNGTGPTSDHTTGNGNYLYIESSACFVQTAELFSSCLDLTNAVSPEASVWYHMTGVAMGELHFDVLADGELIEDVIPVLRFDRGNLWRKATIDMTPYVGKIANVKFRILTGNSFTSDIALDDFELIDTATAVGLNENFLTALRVYPNPSKGNFNIDLGSTVENAQIAVMDINGRIVYENVITTSTTQVDLSNVEKGVYFLQITVNGERTNRKLIVQ